MRQPGDSGCGSSPAASETVNDDEPAGSAYRRVDPPRALGDTPCPGVPLTPAVPCMHPPYRGASEWTMAENAASARTCSSRPCASAAQGMRHGHATRIICCVTAHAVRLTHATNGRPQPGKATWVSVLSAQASPPDRRPTWRRLDGDAGAEQTGQLSNDEGHGQATSRRGHRLVVRVCGAAASPRPGPHG